MVDIEKIRQKIYSLEDNIRKLEILKQFSMDEFSNDFMKVESSKHLLQVSIEIMIDMANHIIARERYTSPVSSSDIFKILCDKKVISENTVNDYRLMAKFRNRIVHIYNEVDTKEIYKIIQNNLDDFKTFISEIVSFIQK